MNKFLPLIFVLLWSSAFVTTKPIVFSRETTEKPQVENITDLLNDDNIWYVF